MPLNAGEQAPKGGVIARNAAMLCQDAQFRLYLDRRRAAKFGLDTPDGTHTMDDARDFILAACGIRSRAELDHNHQAAEIYRQIKHHYSRWLDRQRRRDQQSR